MSETASLLSSLTDSEIDEKGLRENKRRKFSKAQLWLWVFISGALVASLTGNIVQSILYRQLSNRSNSCELTLSGLTPDLKIDFGTKTAYGDISNMTELDRLWYSIDVNGGVVALPYSLHLGSTDSFPWDSSKGLYVLNSYHTLHCLQGIYGFARNCEANRPQTQTMEHVVHCLDVLRAETMCNADDSPLSFRFQEVNPTELPPKRKCRDWSRLERYAESNSACFRRYAPEDPRYETLDEFTFCPPSSPYRALVEQIEGQDVAEPPQRN